MYFKRANGSIILRYWKAVKRHGVISSQLHIIKDGIKKICTSSLLEKAEHSPKKITMFNFSIQRKPVL